MDIHFGNLTQLTWLWLPAVSLAAIIFAVEARRRARKRYATTNLISRMIPGSNKLRGGLCAMLTTIAMVLMVVALVDIRWGKVSREVPQKGIEVMFLLDVSRSMLAEDASPNRLERAKQQIKDLVDEMTGDRVGLVVFAGDARQQIPLTTHYEDFKHELDGVGPHSVRRGGSRLGDAIEVASQSFLTKLNAHKAIVVFTDGEDQESDPIAVAQKVHQNAGVRIFTVGLGDIEKGARIPLAGDGGKTFLQHDGTQVWSKLHGDILRQVAVESDGAYIPAGTKQVNMSAVYHNYIADVDQMEFESAQIDQYEARFQWFLAPALLLMLGDIALATWPTRQSNHVDSRTAFSNQIHSSQHRDRHATVEHSTAA